MVRAVPARGDHPPAASERAGIVLSALNRRGRERFSGTLRLDGSPGGTVVMRNGLVAAATTPAAPGPEPLLLRSGRVSEADWTAAFSAGAPDGRFADELVRRGLLGSAGVEVVTQTAVVDALFAMVLCGVHTCTAGPEGTPPPLPADPGLAPERLAREITRRLAMADGWQARGLTMASRPRATHARETTPLNRSRREILDRANGRRTPRDIAFALGRGVYSVLTDLATLVEDGLAALDPPPAEARVTAPSSVPAGPVPVPTGPDGSIRRRGTAYPGE
ncbi:hypothetical protein [Spirillospora sp. CA-128828]|uniref:hypothetical protein n=1 Tax=Spirillospora sp. CA-128828 TaxID=3240033 RepID=UPI003D8D3E27